MLVVSHLKKPLQLGHGPVVFALRVPIIMVSMIFFTAEERPSIGFQIVGAG